MKKGLILTWGTLLLAIAITASGATGEDAASRTMTVQVEADQTVTATESYVLLLLQTSGVTMTAAKTAADAKLHDFSAQIGKAFPDAVVKAISVNIGTCDFTSYSAASAPLIPSVTRVVICTLPADEAMALDVLDRGVKAGFRPFAGTMNGGPGCAIYYAIKNSEPALDTLRASGIRKLDQEAAQQAALRSDLIGKLTNLSAELTPPEKRRIVECGRIKITLPAEFCGPDRERIPISLSLRGKFDLIPGRAGNP